MWAGPVHTGLMSKRRIGLVVAWVAATATATVLASQAVALVRDQVTDRPSRVATTLALDATTSTTDTTDPTVQPPPPVSTTGFAATTTTTTGEGTSTTNPGGTTTSTSIPPQTTASANQEDTFYGTGGWATVRCAGDDATLVTYAPNPGYRVEIESAGPEKVEISFEASGDDRESTLEVRCDSGVLQPRIDEHDDD